MKDTIMTSVAFVYENADNQQLTRDVEMGGSSTSQQNGQRAKGQGTTCAPLKKRLAAITSEVAEKLQPAHVREVGYIVP
jgi:hypothetical protein